MKSAVEILEEKLSKKWLSNKAVRDGMMACYIKTFQEHDKKSGKARTEAEINKIVHDVAEAIFQELGVGFEVPTREELIRIKTLMNDRLEMTQFGGEDRFLFDEHETTCEALLSKMDESSEDSSRKP
jgi:hypothetical protein